MDKGNGEWCEADRAFRNKVRPAVGVKPNSSIYESRQASKLENKQFDFKIVNSLQARRNSKNGS